MAELVDLTSDTNEPFQSHCAIAPSGRPSNAGEAINLLSSDDELSPAAKSAPHALQAQLAQNLALPSSQLQTDVDLSSQLGADQHASANDIPAPCRQRQNLPARKLKRMYTDINEAQGVDEVCRDASAALSPGSDPRPAGADDGDWDPSERTPPKRRKGAQMTAEERMEAKMAKEREKQQKQQRRAEERAAKKREKEERIAAERAQKAQQRLDKKRSTGKTALQDVTIHLDPELARHRTGREIMGKLEETYGQPGDGGCGMELSQQLPMWPNRSATWSRKVYGSEEGEEEPGPSQRDAGVDWTRQDIPYVLVCFTAEEFVTEVLKDELRSLVERAARVCPDCTLSLLVEGLEHYLVQRTRREFQANGPGGGGFNRAIVDTVVGKLAVRWPGVRHMVVSDVAQAAEHVTGLTRVLAEQPFSVQESYLRSFGCGKPDSAGTNELLKRQPLPHADRRTFFNVLNQAPDTGPQIAYAIASTYPSLGALMAAFQREGGHGAGLLEGLVRPGGSRVGPTNARKLHKIFTCEDPDWCIQDARKS